ncbi:hypothetical protein ACFL2P_01045 [Candidatus Moduliflexota bacterium]|jgi:plasmid stability protein
MAELLVRNLDQETLKRLKLRAKLHHRSLQGEAKLILEEAVAQQLEDAKELIAKIRSQFAGRKFSDSATLIRQDRRR